jgi:hypothetical protein
LTRLPGSTSGLSGTANCAPASSERAEFAVLRGSVPDPESVQEIAYAQVVQVAADPLYADDLVKGHRASLNVAASPRLFLQAVLAGRDRAGT